MAKEDLFEEGKQPAAEKPAVNADKAVVLRHLSMQNMLSTVFMQKS